MNRNLWCATFKRKRHSHHFSKFCSINHYHTASITQTNKHLYQINTNLSNINSLLNHNNNENNNHKTNDNRHKNNTDTNTNDYFSYILLSLLGLSGSLYFNKKIKQQWNDVSACGIMGVVGNSEECVEYLLDGLLILQNRGYDSAGIATISNQDKNIQVTKYASRGTTSDSLDALKREAPGRHLDDTVGLAHTRWATHGAKTDENAHPHCDWKNRLAIVHNGTIENSEPIKRELIKLGIPFQSETDTEVIVNLISFYLDQIDEKTGELYTIEEAFKLALSQMEGSWGIAMISKDRPNEMFAARNGSPLMIGLDPSQNRNFIASEHTAFSMYTNEFIALQDGEIAVLSGNTVSLDNSRIETFDPNDPSVTSSGISSSNSATSHSRSGGGSNGSSIKNAAIAFSPAPYDHWTLKEMMEQPAAVSRALAYGSRMDFDNQVKLGGLETEKDALLQIKHLIMTGCGTSFHAGLYGQRLMQYLNSCDTVQVVDSAEVTADTFPTNDSGLLAISQSGETKDVVNALNTAMLLQIPCLSVVNAVGSMIARMTGCGVYAYAGREHAVASTKAFLSQTTVLALIACWFAQQRETEKKKNKSNIELTPKTTKNENIIASPGSLLDKNRFRNLASPMQLARNSKSNSVEYQKRDALVTALHKLPTYCGLTLDHTRDVCKKIAKELYDENVQHMFVLGKGFAEPIAYEGALKIKEITYVHCEGFSGGALKHGPFALIENGTPIVMIILDDNHAKTMLTNAHEITSRGGKCIFITDNADLIEISGLDTSRIIKIPRNDILTALLAVVPLQYIAYELAVLKGHDPDKPKNLAKAVTVD